MNTWKVILATMVIFGAGVVTGGLLVRSTQRFPRMRWQQAPTPPRPPQPTVAGVMRLDFLRRMERELDLKPDQRERVDKILKEGQERTKRIMEPLEPELHEVVERAREEFLAVLTPDQKARFDQILKQQQQKAKEQHKQSPPAHQQSAPPPTDFSATNTRPSN